jgi:hypothetical protein
VYGRKSKLKAKLETISSRISFKRCNQALSTQGSTGFNLHHLTLASASAAHPLFAISTVR